MILKKEFNILKKFSKGGIIQSEDKYFIKKLSSTGLLNIGFIKTINGYKETAKLTPLGESIFKEEKILRNPLRKFFYQLFNT
jgi:hypothetical protein